jgi:lipopolysaccharide transport system permease protein
MNKLWSCPAALQVLILLFRHRGPFWKTTRVELKKRYAGTVFGLFWVVLYPALLLCVYVFVYLVVFKVRFPGYSEYEYVIYVFSGLVPYLAIWDALTAGAVSIKQNLHLIKNVILPVEFAPARTVATSLIAQTAMLCIVLVMSGYGGMLTGSILLLPLVLVLEFLFVLGCVYIISALGVLLADVAHVINLLMLLLFFLSPIGFKPEMIPPGLEAIITYNPVYYITDAFRAALFYGEIANMKVFLIYVVICLVTFVVGAAFFHRFKTVLVDYE